MSTDPAECAGDGGSIPAEGVDNSIPRVASTEAAFASLFEEVKVLSERSKRAFQRATALQLHLATTWATHAATASRSLDKAVLLAEGASLISTLDPARAIAAAAQIGELVASFGGTDEAEVLPNGCRTDRYV